MAQDNEIVVVYDGECLFCRNYCRLVRLRKAAGLLKLVDARENSPIMDEVTALGLDIDQGMVVKLDGQIYYGSEAINILSLLSSNSDFFNRLNFMIFKSKRLCFILYPVLRACRNFALWLSHIPKINNLQGKKHYE